MKLRVKVNQAAALRRGIDAPTSIVDIEVNPAELSEEARELIAERLDGIEVRVDPGNYSILTVEDPTVSGILEAIAAVEAQKERKIKEQDEFKAQVEAARPDWIKGLKIVQNQWGQFQVQEPEIDNWSIRGELRLDPAYQALDREATLRQKQRQQELEAAQEKEQAEERAKFAAIIQRLGTDMDKERLARRYLTDGQVKTLATQLLTEQVFADCPLPELTAPKESEIDMEDYDAIHEDYGAPEYELGLPKILERDQSMDKDDIDNDIMKRILVAETKLIAWRPNAKFTPWIKGITRDNRDIPWTDRYGLLVQINQEGIHLSRVVEI